ncbi:MAG: hypothetical protein WCB74_03655, partial [Pseudolabrys sp.]
YGTDLKTNSVNCRAPLFNRDQSKQKKGPRHLYRPLPIRSAMVPQKFRELKVPVTEPRLADGR